MSRPPVGFVMALVTTLCVATPGLAEMYRCKGPGGKTLYTSDASQCPGATAHELRGQVQSSGSPAQSRPAKTQASTRRSERSIAGAVAAGQETAWRDKKRQAETRLSAVELREEYVRRFVRACNNGAELWLEDEATGLRKGHSCAEVKAEHADLVAERDQLTHYLAEGLEDECRRAGCLPGWLR